jgi:hypothetical protein
MGKGTPTFKSNLDIALSVSFFLKNNVDIS